MSENLLNDFELRGIIQNFGDEYHKYMNTGGSVNGALKTFNKTLQYLTEKILERDKQMRKIGFKAAREKRIIDDEFKYVYQTFDDYEEKGGKND